MARFALMLAGTIGLAACGGSQQAARPTPSPSERRASPTPSPTPPARTGTATRADAARARPVIKGWSDALRRSDVERAIDYFALPSVVAQGAAVKLTTRSQLRTFFGGLPCGARLQGVERAGRYVVGTFRLAERPGQTCDGPGDLARVAFVIRSGKIGEWRQLITEPQPADP